LEEFKRIVPLSDPDTLEEMEEVEDLNIKYLLNQGPRNTGSGRCECI